MRQSEDIQYGHLLQHIPNKITTNRGYLLLMERVGQLQVNERTKIIIHYNQIHQY